jgi:transcriptional regulator with XRE-family HTH domain
LQREVGEIFGVTKCTIQYWETNRVTPAVRFIPRILEFLEYDPTIGITSESLAERLKAQRRKLGLSRKRLAALLGIDPSNLRGWETGKYRPTRKSLERIDEFLSWRS